MEGAVGAKISLGTAGGCLLEALGYLKAKFRYSALLEQIGHCENVKVFAEVKPTMGFTSVFICIPIGFPASRGSTCA